MKRLLDVDRQPVPGSLTDLVASRSPFKPNPFRKRLIYSKIVARVARKEQPPALRPAFLAAGILLFAASAAAAVGYLEHERQARLAAVPAVTMAPTFDPPKHRFGMPAAPRAVEAPTASSAEAALPLAATNATASSAPAMRSTGEARSALPRAGEDPTLVSDALRALRKQGDPARAQQLLDAYLKSSPRGALTHDALALAIEAAAARNDPRAAEYAHRYLTRYPNGRFRALAERALQRSTRQ